MGEALVAIEAGLFASTRTRLGRESCDEAIDFLLGRIECGADTNALPLGYAIAAHGENFVPVAQGVMQNIAGVREASVQVDAAATLVLNAAAQLTSQSEQLETETGKFLGNIRAA